MTGIARIGAGQHHPWRAFRELTDWTLRWSVLPSGLMGVTDHATQTVTLAEGMSQAERRCTIEHERQHILRGPSSTHRVVREELIVDRRASKLLIPSVADLVDAMVWARGCIDTTADELWVDPFLLEVRLSSLQGRERTYVQSRLDEVRVL